MCLYYSVDAAVTFTTKVCPGRIQFDSPHLVGTICNINDVAADFLGGRGGIELRPLWHIQNIFSPKRERGMVDG